MGSWTGKGITKQKKILSQLPFPPRFPSATSPLATLVH